MVQTVAPSRTAGNVHRIISTAALAVKRVQAESTTLQEIGDSTNGDPFRVLIATVLSQRTRDPVTALASARLFSRYRDVKKLARADARVVSRLIRPVGFYKTKARRIKEISRILLEKHGGRVPEKIEELLELPGVGRKTANCVLVYGFGRPAIPVDTHVHRISNRLGLVHTKTPEETETELTRITDRRDWLELNEVFVKFGQSICRPIGPKCSTCMLNSNCAFYREKKAAV